MTNQHLSILRMKAWEMDRMPQRNVEKMQVLDKRPRIR